MGQVDRMLREMAGAQSVQVVSRTGSVTKLARLVLVAEQFGFMYGDTRQTGGRAPKVVLTIHRDPDQQAQRRAADNFARHPQAGDGGDLPGMQPGGKLKPLPEALAHLELLKARINFDLTGKNAEKRMLMGGIGVTAGFAIALFRSAFEGTAAVFSVVAYVLLLLLLGGGFLWNRKRNARFENVLSQSGLTPVQDENGRTRYLPPGSQLPGHHNPFAQQGFAFPQQAPAHQAAAAPGYQQPQPAAPQWQVPPQPAQQPQHPQQPVPQGQFGHGGPYGQQGQQVPPGQAQPQYYGHPAPPQPGPGQPAPQPPYGQQQPTAPNPYQNGQHS